MNENLLHKYLKFHNFGSRDKFVFLTHSFFLIITVFSMICCTFSGNRKISAKFEKTTYHVFDITAYFYVYITAFRYNVKKRLTRSAQVQNRHVFDIKMQLYHREHCIVFSCGREIASETVLTSTFSTQTFSFKTLQFPACYFMVWPKSCFTIWTKTFVPTIVKLKLFVKKILVHSRLHVKIEQQKL